MVRPSVICPGSLNKTLRSTAALLPPLTHSPRTVLKSRHRPGRLTLNAGQKRIASARVKPNFCNMRSFTAVIEKCTDTGLLVGFVPGFPGAHSQGESLDELHGNLREVIEMLLEDGDPELEAEYIGTQLVTV